jgi:uncharacterized protein (DUF58 family)
LKRRRQDVFDADFLGRLQRLHLIAKQLAPAASAGSRRSRRVGDGLEFADHRDYAAGDDIRFVDWPYYARMEKLLLRLFHEHGDAEVAILADASGSMAPGGRLAKFDYALHVAAAMAYVAMGSLDRVMIAPFASAPLEPMHTGRNRANMPAVLDYLAALEPGGRTDLKAAIARLARTDAPSGAVLLVSDLLDCGGELSDALALLAHHGAAATVVHVYEPADAECQLEGSVLLQAAEDGGQLAVEVTPEVLEAYRAAWRQFQAGCERTCIARGAIYVAAPTSLPFERLVLQSLRRAGVLG